MNQPTIESVSKWLNNSPVSLRNRVNSLQWLHIPTLLTNHIQHQQDEQHQPSTEQSDQFLQTIVATLDECSKSCTPIPNKRLLHSSLSELSQSPSIDPQIKRGACLCLAALNDVEDGQYTIIEKSQLAEMESKDRTIAEQKQKLAQHDQLIAKQNEMERKMAEQEKKVAEQNKLIESLEATRKSFSELKQKHDELQATLSERVNVNGKLKRVLTILTVLILLSVFVVKAFHAEAQQIQQVNEQLRTDLVSNTQNEETHLSSLQSLQNENDQIKTENEELRNELDRRIENEKTQTSSLQSLQKENEQLQNENEKLRQEKADLLDTQKTDRSRIISLQKENEQIKQMNEKLRQENGDLLEKKKRHLSKISALKKERAQLHEEKDQILKESEECQGDLARKTRMLEAKKTRLTRAQQTIEAMKTEEARKEELFVSSNNLVAYSPHRYRMNGLTVTRINSEGWAGCFTKPVSKGIHRLSIKTKVQMVMIGVLDAAEYPKFLTAHVDKSPKAAMMYNLDGQLCSAGKYHAQNTIPHNGQEWSAEADLEKRTLHFFIDGVQQPHHFVNIPVPLVFALDVHNKDGAVEITHWGEETRSHVTFQGTGHNLG
ncbi:hypothetical protein BLNAU_17704 [Blattamonas nauphoetae]|uniref:Uncharacterized protein n=1 Tax=Blattamonas nauphoetae TaxID=2049346 RepID=A0ABQ9X6I4_9EUKA|nr:hypothetical protein BLNAU_17704 [Blattamonas nauphoetae]